MAVEQAEVVGWRAPIYHATLAPRQYLGVPETLCVMNGLAGAMATLTLWWPSCVVALVIHYSAKWLTKLDPCWPGILWRYFQYSLYYRG